MACHPKASIFDDLGLRHNNYLSFYRIAYCPWCVHKAQLTGTALCAFNVCSSIDN